MMVSKFGFSPFPEGWIFQVNHVNPGYAPSDMLWAGHWMQQQLPTWLVKVFQREKTLVEHSRCWLMVGSLRNRWNGFSKNSTVFLRQFLLEKVWRCCWRLLFSSSIFVIPFLLSTASWEDLEHPLVQKVTITVCDRFLACGFCEPFLGGRT